MSSFTFEQSFVVSVNRSVSFSSLGSGTVLSVVVLQDERPVDNAGVVSLSYLDVGLTLSQLF